VHPVRADVLAAAYRSLVLGPQDVKLSWFAADQSGLVQERVRLRGRYQDPDPETGHEDTQPRSERLIHTTNPNPTSRGIQCRFPAPFGESPRTADMRTGRPHASDSVQCCRTG
jgi:hypothetical protein